MDIFGKFKTEYRKPTSSLNIILSIIITIIIFIVIIVVIDKKYIGPSLAVSMIIVPLLYYGIQFIVVKTMYKYNDPHPGKHINGEQLANYSDSVPDTYSDTYNSNSASFGTRGGRNKNTKLHMDRSNDLESSERGDAPPLSSY